MQHMKLIAWNKRKIWKPKPGFLKRGPRFSLGSTERFSRGHEQRSSLGSFVVILHNPSVTIY